MKIKKVLVCLLGCMAVLILCSCGRSSKQITIGFIYPGNVQDPGYTQIQDKARAAMVKKYNGAVQTINRESAETSEIQGIVKDMADAGASVIVSTDSDWDAQIAEAAKNYPNIMFLAYNGSAQAGNIKNDDAKLWQSWYLAGITAGAAAGEGSLGFLTQDLSPATLQAVNAYALGAKTMNDKVQVKLLAGNASMDEAAVTGYVGKLADAGCTVFAAALTDNTAIQAASARGMKVVGFYENGTDSMSDNYLTSPTIDPASFYISAVDEAMAGSLSNAVYTGDLSNEFVKLQEESGIVAPKAKEATAAAAKQIISGSLHVFGGEIKDSSGAVRVEKGQTLSDEALSTMDWTVENVTVISN